MIHRNRRGYLWPRFFSRCICTICARSVLATSRTRKKNIFAVRKCGVIASHKAAWDLRCCCSCCCSCCCCRCCYCKRIRSIDGRKIDFYLPSRHSRRQHQGRAGDEGRNARDKLSIQPGFGWLQVFGEHRVLYTLNRAGQSVSVQRPPNVLLPRRSQPHSLRLLGFFQGCLVVMEKRVTRCTIGRRVHAHQPARPPRLGNFIFSSFFFFFSFPQ